MCVTILIRNPTNTLCMSLCASLLVRNVCVSMCSSRISRETLLTSLCSLEILQRHCLCHRARQDSCRYIVHGIVGAILTAKIVDAMMTVGFIRNKFSIHDTINLSQNVFFNTYKTIHHQSFNSLSDIKHTIYILIIIGGNSLIIDHVRP